MNFDLPLKHSTIDIGTKNHFINVGFERYTYKCAVHSSLGRCRNRFRYPKQLKTFPSNVVRILSVVHAVTWSATTSASRRSVHLTLVNSAVSPHDGPCPSECGRGHRWRPWTPRQTLRATGAEKTIFVSESAHRSSRRWSRADVGRKRVAPEMWFVQTFCTVSRGSNRQHI